MGEYRVYDWLADRTTVIPINISIPARKTVDSYIAERRLDFSNGTLNNEKVFESVKARFLFSLHQPKFYCYLGMPTAYGRSATHFTVDVRYADPSRVQRGDPGESKYKDVNRHMDPRSGARGYRLPRAAASNPGFRILSWIGNEVSASYYRQSDLAVEYGEPWQLLHGTDESINLSSLFIPNGSLGVARI